MLVQGTPAMVHPKGGVDMSTGYATGLAVGIAAALILFAIVWKLNKKIMKGQFDERQELVRGRGYKYACFTLLCLLVVDLIAESYGVFDSTPLTREIAIFVMILAGVMVYALYCIKNDSYFGVGTDTRTYRAVMWVVIVSNAISGFSNLKDGAMVNGKLAFGPCASLLFCLAFVIIMIALYVKKYRLDKEEAAEDDM